MGARPPARPHTLRLSAMARSRVDKDHSGCGRSFGDLALWPGATCATELASVLRVLRASEGHSHEGLMM